MNSIQVNPSQFGIYPMDRSNSDIQADYVIQFTGNVPPIQQSANQSTSNTTSFTSFFLVKAKSDGKKRECQELHGMSCFTDIASRGKDRCTVLSIVKTESGKAPQTLFLVDSTERAKSMQKIQDYNETVKVGKVLERLEGYRNKYIRNSNKRDNWERFLHRTLYNSDDYEPEILVKLKKELIKDLDTADNETKKHLNYEIDAIDAILLARHLEELRDKAIASPQTDEKEYYDFIALFMDESFAGASKTAQNFLAQNEINRKVEDYKPHMKQILKEVTSRISLTKKQEEKIRFEEGAFETDESFGKPTIYTMQDVLHHSKNNKLFEMGTDAISLAPKWNFPKPIQIFKRIAEAADALISKLLHRDAEKPKNEIISSDITDKSEKYQGKRN